MDPRTDIAVNSVHPGHVDTDMRRHEVSVTTEQGAGVPVDLQCLLPAGERNVKGHYVWSDKTVKDWCKC